MLRGCALLFGDQRPKQRGLKSFSKPGPPRSRFSGSSRSLCLCGREVWISTLGGVVERLWEEYTMQNQVCVDLANLKVELTSRRSV